MDDYRHVFRETRIYPLNIDGILECAFALSLAIFKNNDGNNEALSSLDGDIANCYIKEQN